MPGTWSPTCWPVGCRTGRPAAGGRAAPYLLFGGIALAISFAALFAGPDLGGPTADIVWVLVWFLISATAYAAFQVPFVSMPAEMTEDYSERTRLMTWRVAVLALTILATGASAPAIRDALGGREGYRAMGLVIGALILIGAIGCFLGTRRAPLGRIHETSGTLRSQLGIVMRVRDFRWLTATYVLQALAIGTMLAGVDYLANQVLRSPGAATVIFACFVGPALLVTPIWQIIGTRHGKRRGFLAASIILVVGAVVLGGAAALPPAITFAGAGLVGVGYAGSQVFPLAMLPDVAAVDAARSGLNRVGVFTGVWTAAETFGLAVGPGVFALLLTVGGYVSSSGEAAAQPDSAITAIVVGMSVVPAVVLVLSCWCLTRYRLGAVEVRAAVEAGR